MQWRVGVLPYLVVLFAYPLIWLVSVIIALGLAPLAAVAAHWPTIFTAYLSAILIFPAFINLRGGTGLAQLCPGAHAGALRTARGQPVVGLMHGLWHLLIFLLVSGPPAAGPFNLSHLAINTLGILFVSVAFAWVFNRTRQSILIAVLMHASFNAAPAWLAQSVPNLGRTAGYIPSAIYVIVALVLIVATKVQLGYRPAAEPAVGAPGDGVAEVREAA